MKLEEIIALTNTAVELKPGCVYAIECDQHLNCEQRGDLIEWAQEIRKSLGIHFILLHKGLKLVTRPQEIEE